MNGTSPQNVGRWSLVAVTVTGALTLGSVDTWSIETAAAGPMSTVQRQRTYTMYVCAESDDVVEKLSFGPGGFQHIRTIPVGAFPTEIEGPHGLAVSPDGENWFLSIAHGLPFGSIHKFDAETDEWLGDVTVGMFPATMSISASTGLLFVVNFNLHGLPEPSSISVIETESMSEVARIDTGVMPHGSRINARGTHQYSVNMMNDDLVEVDVYRMEVARRLRLSENAPEHLAGSVIDSGDGQGADREIVMKMPLVKPTWATAPTPQGTLYVAGNGAAVVLEVDVDAWEITRRFDTLAGPYNIDITADGSLLVVTYKSSKSVGFWDLKTGREVGRIDTLRPIPHGVIVSPDGRYAFATMEGIGGEPGSVEAYDLKTFQRVGNIDIAKQAGGIAVWKTE